MAFTFPDPNIETEVTAPNGITYSWDPVDEKWNIKTFNVDNDDRYVNIESGDSMEGPLIIQAQDPTDGRATNKIQTLGVFSNSDSSALRLGTTRDRVYVGHNDTSINGPVKIQEVQEKNAGTGISVSNTLFLQDNQIKNLAVATDDSDAVPLVQLQENVNILQNGIIELGQEIDAIAPSVERGQFISTTYSNAPRDGEFMLSTISGKTVDYGNPDIVMIQISKEDNEGITHTYADVAAGQLMQLFEEGIPDYGLYLIEAVAGNTDSSTTVVTFTVSPVSGFGEATEGDLARLKIFSAPSGGTADGFVLKTGDTMEGPNPLVFKTKATGTSYNNPPTNTSYLKFVNDKNGSITSGSLWLGGNTNILTTDLGLMVRGSIYTKEYYYAYGSNSTGKPRIRLQSSTGSLQSDSTVALSWDSTGVKKIRLNDSEGSSGKVLRLNSSKVPYWSDPPMPTYTITKTNGNYYVS